MAARLHVLLQGRVQGVGFRYATRAQADELGLTGWVRNVPGGVEALFEGPEETLRVMLGWVRKGPPFAQVDGVEETWSEAPREFEDFRIAR